MKSLLSQWKKKSRASTFQSNNKILRMHCGGATRTMPDLNQVTLLIIIFIINSGVGHLTRSRNYSIINIERVMRMRDEIYIDYEKANLLLQFQDVEIEEAYARCLKNGKVK